ESVYISSGVLDSQTLNVKWVGDKQLRKSKIDEIFLSNVTQLDCFMIHGTGYDSIEMVLDNPDEMGVATMPRGCSMELDQTGVPVRDGKKAISTGGWWWGIPKNSPNPVVSFNLLSHVTGI
ncbi:MAG: hypothetical protein Q4F84_05130, partial [Fibrobacter sp.]|nr:hypothetical protein [Fibrobacter sp.]